MFQQFYETHPALKGFVNNIMINEMKFEAKENSYGFSIPPLPEHSIMFYVRDRVKVGEADSFYKMKIIVESFLLKLAGRLT
jgi:hypothetical protein